LILSHHDLNGTPANLDAVFDALAATPAAVIKCVFTARDATDSCRVLEQLRLRGDKRPMIALAMGEVGLMTRVLARRFSAFLTFASCEAGLPSAPGQPTIAELRECYHWDQIDADTRVYGVIGWPVTHSRSPHIHNAAMRADRMNAVYVPVPVAPTYEDLAAFLDYVVAHPRLEFRGFSVTIPHKEHTLRWIEQRGADATALARRCGAVNTLARSGDRWVGDNTDAPAMLDALATVPGLSREELSGRRIAILGAGGAARAAAVALRDGECDVTLLNRTDARAQALAATIGCEAQPWSERIRGDCDILINCTSAGMSPRSEETPFPAEALRPEMIVFDTVYNPVETRLLREARAAGCRTISGIEMFVAQAAAQYRRWHRTEASREIMRAALSK
jgi:3-dehydroquinate dehydratase/shikimate dehydrogenase